MSTATIQDLRPGLEGVVAATTRLSAIDGERGELLIGGIPVEELAPHASFEEAVHLLWHGELPDRASLDGFRRRLSTQRHLPEGALDLLARAARAGASPMAALGLALGLVRLETSHQPGEWNAETAQRLVAAIPPLVAAYGRVRAGQDPIVPPDGASHAAAFLWALEGREPAPERVRALDTYLVTVIDHGMNASTFAARVIASTHSDLVSAAIGALGALDGPLHGGAPGPALDMVFEIGTIERAEPELRRRLEAGERLMGFGHRVYKTRDPRAEVLSAAAERLARSGEAKELNDLARAVEAVALRLLAELKPGRRLYTNVEFYTALVLHGVGLRQELFTPLFAASRMAGWMAHCREQLAEGRLLRPSSVYVGPRKGWVALEERA
ncbi:MAG TPA: citrate synthase [Thermoanaerobaculia bacterium]|nr:citrate synthase [Thermoanaerobaculia bacterium]